MQKIFTEDNEDNEGLEQPIYHIPLTKIFKSQAEREAPSFPLLPSVQKYFLQEETEITEGCDSCAITSL